MMKWMEKERDGRIEAAASTMTLLGAAWQARGDRMQHRYARSFLPLCGPLAYDVTGRTRVVCQWSVSSSEQHITRPHLGGLGNFLLCPSLTTRTHSHPPRMHRHHIGNRFSFSMPLSIVAGRLVLLFLSPRPPSAHAPVKLIRIALLFALGVEEQLAYMRRDVFCVLCMLCVICM